MKQVFVGDGEMSVSDIAHSLRVNFERPEHVEESQNAAPPNRGWCAGNESRALGYLWTAMASGNAIDEQRLARFSNIVQQTHKLAPDTKQAEAPPPAPAPSADDSDSDRDPNDIIPRRQTTAPNKTAANDPYASDEDDYLDF